MIDYFRTHPKSAACASALCLLDATNCVANGHADWYVPAFLAFCFALMVNPS